MNIETFGFGDQFTPEEAFELLNSHVVNKEDENNKNLAIEQIGFVAGVITLNDEVEVMIKFPKQLIQLTKTAFAEQMTLLEMP
ncbi:hypothetical protein [Colwellia sp. BRX10-4]|jgi:hypothetical protein|uniref:hypothetical protein n=1 Tax=Colwellia sp. BRX10-4 TaxID=2759843 RepID=UPI0015F394B8|nr:hypothetical protein [Colwellia sp. BRX10-4]MBA6399460.1 hypothetical protein [Colwellia sp. BRX10-4]